MQHTPVSIITGAGSGIGRSTALLLARQGQRVMLIGRSLEKLGSTLRLIQSNAPGVEAFAFPADVSEPAACRSIAEEAIRRFKRVDALINNAAITRLAPIEQTTEAILTEIFATNAFGPAVLIASLWPQFMKQGGGCIVNVSSMSTVDPFPGLGVYAASKAALESLARTIANEGRPHRIRAFNVAPGAVETPMLRSLFDASVLPAERTLTPESIAMVIAECIAGRRDADIGRTILVPSR